MEESEIDKQQVLIKLLTLVKLCNVKGIITLDSVPFQIQAKELESTQRVHTSAILNTEQSYYRFQTMLW